MDTDERTIPNEVGWLATAVHLDKGCYRGQETVARVHNLGRPPRRLVMLNLDGSGGPLPETGDPVTTAPAASSAGSAPSPSTTRTARSRWPWSSGPSKPGTPLLAGGVDAAVDPDDARTRPIATAPVSAIDRRAFSQIRRS